MLEDSIQQARSLGLIRPVKRDSTQTSHISAQPITFEGGFDEDYDTGIVPGVDVNEQRAALQTSSDLIWSGIGRAAGRFSAEIAKMLPSAAGLIGYAGTELGQGIFGQGFGQENFGEYVNNAWVNALDEGIAESVNESLPVYVSDAVKNGNLRTR